MVCLLDYQLLGGAISQAQTAGWVSSEGKIKEISELEHPGDEGTTYSVGVSYQYQYGGSSYTGSKVTMSNLGASSDRQWVQNYIESHPAGGISRVYVNPDNPSQAVLESGPQGMDLFLLMFAGPFNALMLFGWLHVLGYTTADNPSQRGFMCKLRAAAAGASIGMGCLTFPSVFAVAIFVGLHPSALLMEIWWGFIGITCLWFAWSSFNDQRTSIQTGPSGRSE